MLDIFLNSENYYNKGLEAFEEGEFTKAKSYFEKALKKSDNPRDARYNLGLTYINLKEYKKALGCFDEILKESASDSDALFNQALTYQLMGDFEKAQAAYANILSKKPEDIDSNFNLGVINYEKTEYDVALEYFEKVKTIDPGYLNAQFGSVRCKDKLCDYDNSEKINEIFQEYTELMGKGFMDEDFQVAFARSYAKAGHINNALKICCQILTLNSDNPQALSLFGLIRLLKRDVEKAKKSIKKAIMLNPQNPENYNILSYVYAQEKNSEKSEIFKKKYEELISSEN